MLATFLFQMCHQNFTVLIFFLSSSSIQRTNKKSGFQLWAEVSVLQTTVICMVRSLNARCCCVQWQYKLLYILPHSPPMGVPVLWQDSLLRNVSHFLVSNVQSKFYRLDLLLLVFFFNSNDQQKVLHSLLRCSLYCHAGNWQQATKTKKRRAKKGGANPTQRGTDPSNWQQQQRKEEKKEKTEGGDANPTLKEELTPPKTKVDEDT